MMVINMVLWHIQLNRLLVEDGLSLFQICRFFSVVFIRTDGVMMPCPYTARYSLNGGLQ